MKGTAQVRFIYEANGSRVRRHLTIFPEGWQEESPRQKKPSRQGLGSLSIPVCFRRISPAAASLLFSPRQTPPAAVIAAHLTGKAVRAGMFLSTARLFFGDIDLACSIGEIDKWHPGPPRPCLQARTAPLN